MSRFQMDRSSRTALYCNPILNPITNSRVSTSVSPKCGSEDFFSVEEINTNSETDTSDACVYVLEKREARSGGTVIEL